MSPSGDDMMDEDMFFATLKKKEDLIRQLEYELAVQKRKVTEIQNDYANINNEFVYIREQLAFLAKKPDDAVWFLALRAKHAIQRLTLALEAAHKPKLF